MNVLRNEFRPGKLFIEQILFSFSIWNKIFNNSQSQFKLKSNKSVSRLLTHTYVNAMFSSIPWICCFLYIISFASLYRPFYIHYVATVSFIQIARNKKNTESNYKFHGISTTEIPICCCFSSLCFILIWLAIRKLASAQSWILFLIFCAKNAWTCVCVCVCYCIVYAKVFLI